MYNTGWIKWNDWLSVRWPGVSQDTAASNMLSCITYWYWKNFYLSSTLKSLHWTDISYWHLPRNKLPTICKNQFPQNLMATARGTPADTERDKDLSSISWYAKHMMHASKTCQVSADTQSTWCMHQGLVKYQLIPKAHDACVKDLSSISWYPKHMMNASKTRQVSADIRDTVRIKSLSSIDRNTF